LDGHDELELLGIHLAFFGSPTLVGASAPRTSATLQTG
jgi:hypothetical protein